MRFISLKKETDWSVNYKYRRLTVRLFVQKDLVLAAMLVQQSPLFLSEKQYPGLSRSRSDRPVQDVMKLCNNRKTCPTYPMAKSTRAAYSVYSNLVFLPLITLR